MEPFPPQGEEEEDEEEKEKEKQEEPLPASRPTPIHGTNYMHPRATGEKQ